MREKTNHSMGIMDERGRSNPEDNSQMLWNSEWEELRGNLLYLQDRLDYFIHEHANSM